MSKSKQTGNPIFDMWLSNQEQFLKAQSQWLNPVGGERQSLGAEFLDHSLKSWKRCEEQYHSWMKAAENWIGGAKEDKGSPGQENYSGQALSYLLNPATFMQSGFEMMDQIFRKLVNGPEFADIGMLEKKVLKAGKDWQAFRDASHNYQEVIASAWLRAYQHFSDEFLERMNDKELSTEDTLQRWLKIADEELVTTLRSPEFLEAQRELFAAGTAYKLKYREFAEMWCESHTIPTRSEVDDLHRIIHELRREVRELKRQMKQQSGVKPKPEARGKAKPKAKIKTKAKVKAKKTRTVRD